MGDKISPQPYLDLLSSTLLTVWLGFTRSVHILEIPVFFKLICMVCEWSAVFMMLQSQRFSRYWRYVSLHALNFEKEEEVQEEKWVFGMSELSLIHATIDFSLSLYKSSKLNTCSPFLSLFSWLMLSIQSMLINLPRVMRSLFASLVFIYPGKWK